MREYKLLSFSTDQDVRAGLLIGDDVYDIAQLTGRDDFAQIEDILKHWQKADALLATASANPEIAPRKLADINVLAPVSRPGAIYCAGANYQDHVDNMAKVKGVDMGVSPRELGLPPFYFMKSVHCITGTNTSISIDSKALDYEGELAAVIGFDAYKVRVEDALHYVAGYTVANDMSARDRFTRRDIPADSPFRFDWIGHKNFDGSCPIGPYLVPSRFISDPQDLRLKTWVNGELRQNSSTAGMIYPLAELIASLSEYTTLRPGDLILSGTPAGVAAETGRFLKSGDVIKIEIELIGCIENRVVI